VNDTQWVTLTINNAIPSGAAFGYDQITGASCFIPASVMFSTGAQIGEMVEVLLIDNPNLAARARTPYMVQHLRKASRQASPILTPRTAPIVTPTRPPTDLAEFVRTCLHSGGVWTITDILAEADVSVSSEDPRAQYIISSTLRTMFANNECAMWTMYTNGDATIPQRTWFSCFPQNVDVAEWEGE